MSDQQNDQQPDQQPVINLDADEYNANWLRLLAQQRADAEPTDEAPPVTSPHAK